MAGKSFPLSFVAIRDAEAVDLSAASAAALPLPCFRFRFQQNVVILLLAIPPTNEMWKRLTQLTFYPQKYESHRNMCTKYLNLSSVILILSLL